MMIYDPTSYEIYRDVLPTGAENARADEIARLQLARVKAFADSQSWNFCDMTPAFRERVREGHRGLFGKIDGVSLVPGWDNDRGRDHRRLPSSG